MQADAFLKHLKPGTDLKNIALGDVLSAVLRSNYLRYAAGVPGGGIGKQLAYFKRWDIPVSNSAFETSSVAELMGFLKSSPEPGVACTYSTHMIGFVQAAGMMDYLCKKARIPAIALIGGNVDGQTTRGNFQNGDPDEYRSLFGNNMFLITKEKDPNRYIERMITELQPMMQRMILQGTSGVVSQPYNLTSEKTAFSWSVLQELMASPNISAPPLSGEAKAQCNRMLELYAEEGSRVVYLPLSGFANADRLSGNRSLAGFHELSEHKMVGNVIVDPDNAHLLSGKPIEFVPPSHVYDANIDTAVRKFNIIVCIGGGPNAAVSFNRAGLSTYQNRAQTGRFFMVDSAENLVEWKKEFPNIIGIEADPRSFIEHMNQQDFSGINTQLKYQIAVGAAVELRKMTSEGALVNKDGSPIAGAEEMRNIHMAIASGLKQEEGRVCIILDSGNSPGKMFKYLDYSRQNKMDIIDANELKNLPSSKVIYGDEGMLGYVAGAAIGAIKSGKYDKVLIITGDGGASYISNGECAIINQASKKHNTATNLLVFANGGHLSVEASFPLGADSDYIKRLAYEETVKEVVNYHNLSAVIPGARSSLVEPTPNHIAEAIHQGFKEPGLNVLQSDIHSIQATKLWTRA